MTRTNRATLFAIAVLLVLPLSAFADPIPPFSGRGQLWSFPFETVILAALLYRKGFDPIRLFYIWTPITIATFLVFAVSLALMAFAALHAPRMSDVVTIITVCAVLLLFEAAVVVVEGLILRILSRWTFMRPRERPPISLRYFFLVSFLGNLGSLLLGAFWY